MSTTKRSYPDRTVTLNPENYKVAWIAPLEIEAKAALYLLDERHHGRFAVGPGDDYVFQAGVMGGHNIVIATLPAGQEYGTGSAAALASHVKRFFPNLWFGLLVGVAAGLPDLSRRRDIRLGDVLVGLPEGESAGLIAYDLGKETEDGFQLLRAGHSLAMTEPIVRSAIGSLKLESPNESEHFLPYYMKMADCQHATGTFTDPGQDNDILYDQDEHIPRSQRPAHQRTRVWYGPIGSGDKLLKNAEKRNELRDKYGLIGLEMEAAGTMNRIPVGVIRGVCDYGDQRKNKDWQPYAAAMAASYARALLDVIPPAKQPDSRPATTKRTEETHPQTCHYIPLPKNPRFTGRASIINLLYEKLFGQEEIQRMALVGLGGVGKTQIALHLAYHIKERHPEYSIFWVPTLSYESTERAYREIANRLGLQQSNKDDEDVTELVCRHLSADKAGKWLLIVDNADDEEMIYGSHDRPGLEELFPQSEYGHILLTTRSGTVAHDFAQPDDVIDVEQLDQDEAFNLFKGSLTQKKLLENEDLVVELLTHLTFFPLAITQAAAYLNQTRAPLQAYLRLLKGAEADIGRVLGREFRDNTRYRGSRNAIGTTWVISFEQIQRSNPLASDLLSFISFIEPKAIPQSLLPDTDAEPEELEWAIGILCNYSFLTRREDSQVFDMHNLVHTATRGWLEKKNQDKQVFNNAIGHLAERFPEEKDIHFAMRKEYTPHAMRLLNRDHERIDATYSLFEKVGESIYADRRFTESLRCFEEAYSLRRKQLPETDRIRLKSEWRLADVYIECRRFKDATNMLQHVVKAQAQLLAEDDTAQLKAKTSLGIAYLKDRQYEDAIEILQQVMAIQKYHDEKDHDRLLSEHSLALAYLDTGRTRDAIELLEHVVAIKKETLGEGLRQRLVSESTLAQAYRADRRIDEAIEILEHVVIFEKESLEERDLARLSSEQTLAMAYLDADRTEEAIEILEHVVKVKQEVMDERDQSRLASELQLAMAYLDVYRTKEATGILDHVVTVEKGMLEEGDILEGDPLRLQSMYGLAVAYVAANRIKDAIGVLEPLAAIQKEVMDEKDKNRIKTQCELARAYYYDGRFQDAADILELIVAINVETLAEDDSHQMASEKWLKSCYEKLEQTQGSKEVGDSDSG